MLRRIPRLGPRASAASPKKLRHLPIALPTSAAASIKSSPPSLPASRQSSGEEFLGWIEPIATDQPRNMNRRFEGLFEYLLELLPCPRVGDDRPGHLVVGRVDCRFQIAAGADLTVEPGIE